MGEGTAVVGFGPLPALFNGRSEIHDCRFSFSHTLKSQAPSEDRLQVPWAQFDGLGVFRNGMFVVLGLGEFLPVAIMGVGICGSGFCFLRHASLYPRNGRIGKRL